MRILRGKSNLEVSSQGFAWFVLGLVIATFIGGAVRTVLTSDRVHKRIVSELRSRFPQQDFEIGPTEVLLSRGIWPSLGLRVKDLRFRQDVCGKLSFEVSVPQAVLPVDLFALRKGKMRLGRVELSNGRLHLNYRPCPNDRPQALSEAGSVAQRPVLKAPSLNWNKVSEHLNAIDLNNFTVTYERNATWKLIVPGMQFDFDGDLSAQGTMELQKSLPSGKLSHVVEFEAQGDEQILRWSVQSEFKEGIGQLQGSLDLNTHAAQVTFNARQLPMKDVASELFQMGFLDREIRIKAAWLSCGLSWEGPVEKPDATPFLAHDCKVEGAYGRIELGEGEFWPGHLKELKKPALLKVSKLQMQPLLEALGREVLPKVLARPGIWTGEFEYLNPASWKLDGHLENLEVVFSNRSVRGKQTIEKLRTKVDRADGRIQAAIDEVDIRGGEFAGLLNFSLHDDWRNGEFQAQVEKLRLGSSIQTLLTGGTLGNLKFHGQGRLTEGELGRWDGEFDLEGAAGEGWSAEGLNVKSRYVPGEFHLEGRARNGKISERWPLYPQLQLVRADTSGQVVWREVQAKVEINSNGGQIHSVSAVEDELNQVWRLKGSWVRDGEFNGFLSTGAPKKSRGFALSGEKGSLNVQERLR